MLSERMIAAVTQALHIGKSVLAPAVLDEELLEDEGAFFRELVDELMAEDPRTAIGDLVLTAATFLIYWAAETGKDEHEILQNFALTGTPVPNKLQ